MSDQDVTAIQRLSLLYARGADRNLTALWEEIFTEDALLEGPHFRMEGSAAISAAPAMLARDFIATQHRMSNLFITVDGAKATGEVYCVAEHLFEKDGERKLMVWTIRYDDVYRKDDGVWRIAHRILNLDWTETRTVDRPA
ncbi:MAG: nuclear transport factor 2 family protein [Hyphomonadaceae bacterium]|nr:nuclear transport factor 2 family protein [Hyphomonadaceae bacterium]